MPDRPSLRVRALRTVAVAVVLQVVYVVFFVVPGHAPAPNDLPVAVVAQPAAGEVVPQVQALDYQGFAVRTVPSEAAARTAVLEREVLGAFAGRRVLVASAAGVPVATVLAEAGRSAGAREVVDVRPIDPDDPRGTTLNLFVLPLIVTGILIAMVAAGQLAGLDVRGRLLVTAAAAFAGSLLTVLVVNVLIGALPGPYAALAGIATLGVLALALCSGGLVALLGPGGIGLAFVLFLVLGSPASGLASAPELLPSPWAELGWLLPPGAMGDALRGTAYFDGAGVAGPLLVLLGWCALGVALQALARRRRGAAAGAAQPAGG